MREALQPALLITATSGAFAIAVLTFTGSMWPSSPDAGRIHLAFANAISGIGFLSCAICLAAGLIAGGEQQSRLLKTINLLTGGIFLVGFSACAIQLTEAMGTWFAETPTMGAGLIFVVRTLLLLSTVVLFCGVFVRLSRRVRFQRG